jgi:branched-chain amino acid transport system substrate-binding protein
LKPLGRFILAALLLGTVISSATVGAASAASAATASGTPIVVGAVNDVTGAEASVYGSTNKTLQAWADWTNANGGINGHPVKMIALDDQLNPTTAVTEVKQLVEQDHVIAIVGEQSGYDSNFAVYLKQQGIPLIGDGLYNEVAYSYTNAYPQGTTNLAETYNIAALGTQKGLKKMAIFYCAEAPACALSSPLLKKDIAHQGGSVVYSASVSASAPNYTAQCLGAKDAGAQFAFIADSTPVSIRIAQNCQQQGVHLVQVNTGLGVTAQLATPVMNGMMAVEPVMPYFNTSSPPIKTMVSALNKYAPGVVGGTSYGMSEPYAWAAGLLFTAGAKAANASGNLTSAQLTKGLESLHNTTLGGISPPLSFPAGQDHHVSCSFVIGLKNSKFYMPQGNKLLCAPKAYS